MENINQLTTAEKNIEEDLRKTAEFLGSFTESEFEKYPLVDPNGLLALKKNLDELQNFERQKLSIYLVGEFSSGKSTLVNSIIGNEYAPTNLFELTAWTARYWSGSEEIWSVRFKDGKEVVIDRDEFLEKCKIKKYSKDELDKIDYIDISLKGDDFNYVLSDTPGFGGLNESNEKRLIDGLIKADVVLWVIDVDSLGSIKERALINELKNEGIPLAAVLAKCDLLESDEEVWEIKQYISKNFNISDNDIIPTSAKYALENSKKNSGIDELKSKLNNYGSRSKEVVKESKNALLNRAINIAQDCLVSLENNLVKAKDLSEKWDNILGKIKESVILELEEDIDKFISDELFSSSKDLLHREFKLAITESKGSLSEEQIKNCLDEVEGKDYFKRFDNRFINHLQGKLKEHWDFYLEKHFEQLSSILSDFNQDLIEDSSSILFGSKVTTFNDVAKESFASSMKVTTGVAAAFTAYAAWLGPAAAAISLPAAFTGLGIPILFFGGVISWFKGRRDKKKAEENLEAIAKDIIDMIIKETKKKYRDNYSKVLVDINDTMKLRVLEKLVKKTIVLPSGSIFNLLQATRNHNNIFNKMNNK